MPLQKLLTSGRSVSPRISVAVTAREVEGVGRYGNVLFLEDLKTLTSLVGRGEEGAGAPWSTFKTWCLLSLLQSN